MTGEDRQHLEAAALSRLVHDLANPLSAVLTEAQLLLLDAAHLSPDAVTSLKAIETAALRMRTILRESSALRKL
ncbi:MAG TPA: histidine kinase dimerization/phospho-acceptor domain-containing protein [Gemmatimonadales bacterium]|nr:histidine kinase dimerization/phospho-acceptor domain-containing protein [Gemmatimonadales bacterium]